MKIDDEITKTRRHLRKLEDKRRKDTPKLSDFSKLIRIRFHDCLDCLPLKKMGLKNNRDLKDTDENRWVLTTTLMVLYSFYAGRIFEDADQTGLYKGPAVHRIHTIFGGYFSHLDKLDSESIPFSGTGAKSQTVRQVYHDLNSMGANEK